MPTCRTIAMRLSVALSACVLLTAAAAPGQKPAVSIKTKAIEATVIVEKTLDAYPGLMTGLINEGRAAAEKARREADTDRRANPSSFANGRTWTFERTYSQRSVIGRYVSILRTDDTFQGGAHPNQQIDTILWDRDAKKRISIRPFFKETADKGPAMTAMAKLVRAAVHAEKKRKGIEVEGTPDTDDWLKGVEPRLLKLGPVTLAPSAEAGKSAGLTFHFSPYMVGPYAEGPLTAFVAWTDFKDSLSPEGVALFGGTRAKGDAETFE